MDCINKIDVLINSCARPDVLDVAFNSFLSNVETTYDLRFVILEDKVEDSKRQALGKKWIDKNIDKLDKIVYSDKILGPGKFFAPTVKLCESDYFFHLEDDNEFTSKIKLDSIIEVLKNNNNIVEIILSRGKKYTEYEIINGVRLSKLDLFSVATGVFNTKLVKKIIDQLGWEECLHEFETLTPMSKKLGMKKYILGHGEQHYVHVGELKNYRKGQWK